MYDRAVEQKLSQLCADVVKLLVTDETIVQRVRHVTKPHLLSPAQRSSEALGRHRALTEDGLQAWLMKALAQTFFNLLGDVSTGLISPKFTKAVTQAVFGTLNSVSSDIDGTTCCRENEEMLGGLIVTMKSFFTGRGLAAKQRMNSVLSQTDVDPDRREDAAAERRPSSDLTPLQDLVSADGETSPLDPAEARDLRQFKEGTHLLSNLILLYTLLKQVKPNKRRTPAETPDHRAAGRRSSSVRGKQPSFLWKVKEFVSLVRR